MLERILGPDELEDTIAAAVSSQLVSMPRTIMEERGGGREVAHRSYLSIP